MSIVIEVTKAMLPSINNSIKKVFVFMPMVVMELNLFLTFAIKDVYN